MTRARGPAPRAAPPEISRRVLRFFLRYLRRYLGKHWNAVRLSRGGPPPVSERPLLLYTNHPSWWDPILFGWTVYEAWPQRDLYGPMDARALEKYGIFKRLGVFGVELDSRRGAARFLRTSLAILERPRAARWVTAQGEFADARERPVRLRHGVARLALRAPAVDVVPVALEYAFWNERLPEAFVRFAEPVELEGEDRESANQKLERALERVQDELAAEVRARDPAAFVPLLEGRQGVGGVYDLGRRLVARLRGRKLAAGHGFLRGEGEAR